jgi:hypothetical protein
MKILRKDTDLNILLNTETDFQTNLGWEENLKEFETEVLNDIINPIENYETVRYIHKPYLSDGVEQTDIWFYFYFLSDGTYTQDYTPQGISSQENESMLKQATESFFRLEFFKTPGTVSGNVLTCEPPTRQNRKLIFAKNLSLPLGEKMFYNPLNGYIHLPVFRGSNYSNKENMYFFWFQDESVLTETNLSGTTTGNTFFMTAKFYNAKEGTILDFTNDCYSTGHTITEQNDMYYQVDIDKRDYSYQVYKYDGISRGTKSGITNIPIKFYEKGGGNCFTLSPTPTPTITPTNTPTPTPTPTPTATQSCSGCQSYYINTSGNAGDEGGGTYVDCNGLSQNWYVDNVTPTYLCSLSLPVQTSGIGVNISNCLGLCETPTASFSTSQITASTFSTNADTTVTSSTTITVVGGTVTIRLKTWVETGYRANTSITINGSSYAPSFAGDGATPLAGTGIGNASYTTFPLGVGIYSITNWTVTADYNSGNTVAFAKLEQVI